MTLADQTSVAVAIYNDDLALVRDARRITLNEGRNRLALVDVSGRLRAETALLVPQGGAQSACSRRTSNFDLLTPQKLLEKSVGKEVTIVKTHPQTGEETRIRALVLSTRGDRAPDRQRDPHLGAGPHRVRRRPAQSPRPADPDHRPRIGPRRHLPVELTYPTGGLGWRADYVAQLDGKENRIELNGWVTLVRPGAAPPIATPSCSSSPATPTACAPAWTARGRRRRARPHPRGPCAPRRCSTITSTSSSAPTTIAENEQKQVALLNAGDVTVRRNTASPRDGRVLPQPLRRARHGQGRSISHFVNDRRRIFGLPLPRGIDPRLASAISPARRSSWARTRSTTPPRASRCA